MEVQEVELQLEIGPKCEECHWHESNGQCSILSIGCVNSRTRPYFQPRFGYECQVCYARFAAYSILCPNCGHPDIALIGRH